MYLSASRSGDVATGVPPPAPVAGGAARARVCANVVALGVVSLVTDVSAEMVTAVLPVYLVTGLGLTMLQFGLLDGLATGTTVALRLLGAQVADRFGARKRTAAVGYGLSAATRIGLPLAGASVTGIGAMLAVDRAGKGLRTAPRDALISLSSSPQAQGRAFGVHRALDTAGAFAGPLLAFALLSAADTAYDAVFVVSFCVALAGLLVLVLFVRERPAPPPGTPRVTWRAIPLLLRGADLRRLCAGAAILGAATVGDAFVYLLLQRELALPVHWFALLPLGTAGTFLLLAVPVGRLADRVGRRRVLLGGHVALLAVYVLLAGPAGGAVLVIGVLVLHGLFYAATDGVLMAAAGAGLPEGLRTTGLALLQSAQALGRLVASAAFGAAWTLWGPRRAVEVFAAALVAALAAAAVLVRTRRPAGEGTT